MAKLLSRTAASAAGQIGLFGGLAFLILSQAASANIGEAFGFGARTQALGGAGVAWGGEGFTAYTNPASLPLAGEDESKTLILSFGLIDMTPNITPIQNVVTNTAFNSDNAVGSPTYGNVDTGYRTTFGEELGIAYDAFPDTYHLTFGLVAFLPVNQVALVDTGETYEPEYVLLRARTQRPQIELSVGADLGKGFHAGAGLHTGFSLTSNGTVFLKTNATQPSTMRFSSSIQTKFGPTLGFLFAPPDAPDAYSVGIVYRFPVSYDNVITFNSDAQFFGTSASIPFSFSANSALYYDPAALEIGTSIRHGTTARTFLQVDYELWNKYVSPNLVIGTSTETCSPGPCTSTITPSQSLPFVYQNIVVPRFGEEVYLSQLATLRLGYSYHASIIQGTPTGAGNFLDPPKHALSAGVGLKFSHFLKYEIPASLDFALEYEQLVTQHITKSAGDENGNLGGDPKIGSPGYDAGGNILGGGLTLTLAL